MTKRTGPLSTGANFPEFEGLNESEQKKVVDKWLKNLPNTITEALNQSKRLGKLQTSILLSYARATPAFHKSLHRHLGFIRKHLGDEAKPLPPAPPGLLRAISAEPYVQLTEKGIKIPDPKELIGSDNKELGFSKKNADEQVEELGKNMRIPPGSTVKITFEEFEKTHIPWMQASLGWPDIPWKSDAFPGELSEKTKAIRKLSAKGLIVLDKGARKPGTTEKEYLRQHTKRIKLTSAGARVAQVKFFQASYGDTAAPRLAYGGKGLTDYVDRKKTITYYDTMLNHLQDLEDPEAIEVFIEKWGFKDLDVKRKCPECNQSVHYRATRCKNCKRNLK